MGSLRAFTGLDSGLRKQLTQNLAKQKSDTTIVCPADDNAHLLRDMFAIMFCSK